MIQPIQIHEWLEGTARIFEWDMPPAGPKARGAIMRGTVTPSSERHE